MPDRFKTLFTLLQGFTAENWHYVVGWALITFQWAANMPEWVSKILVAIATGFALAFGKWCFEWGQKKVQDWWRGDA